MKNIKIHRKYVFLITTLILFLACQSQKNQSKVEDLMDISIDSSSIFMKYQTARFSLPSPHHANFLIKQNNIPYNKELPNPHQNYSKYASTTKIALNIGVFGADLGYLNIYNKHQRAMDYLLAIKQLSQELQLNQAFSQETITKIENNFENTNYILNIISRTYQNIDKYLTQNNQEMVGALILAGSWLESTYILTQTWEQTRDQTLLRHIAHQKYALQKLIKLLAPYYNHSEECAQITNLLTDIAYEYDCIDINYEYHSPKTFPERKMTHIKSQSQFELNNYNFTKLAKLIAKARNQCIN